DVKADRTYGCFVAQAHSNRIGVLTREVFEPDSIENISAVIERGESQAFLYRHRKAKFGIDYQKLRPASRHTNQTACGRVGGIVARRDRALRSRTVQWKASKRTAAAREKKLAYRNVTAGGRPGKSNPDTIGPHHVLQALVRCSLSQKLTEI